MLSRLFKKKTNTPLEPAPSPYEAIEVAEYISNFFTTRSFSACDKKVVFSGERGTYNSTVSIDCDGHLLVTIKERHNSVPLRYNLRIVKEKSPAIYDIILMHFESNTNYNRLATRICSVANLEARTESLLAALGVVLELKRARLVYLSNGVQLVVDREVIFNAFYALDETKSDESRVTGGYAPAPSVTVYNEEVFTHIVIFNTTIRFDNSDVYAKSIMGTLKNAFTKERKGLYLLEHF